MPGSISRARDPDLLDALEALPRTTFKGSVWRVVREGRDPVQPARVGGRWDIGGTADAVDVLYTSCDPDGAIAEIEFHLNREQPVFPSKMRSNLFELHAAAYSIIQFETLEQLIPFGVEVEHYHEPLYGRTQEIGDAVSFLGCDGLVVPNARWPCLNLVLFANSGTIEAEPIATASLIDWPTWRKANPIDRRNVKEPLR